MNNFEKIKNMNIEELSHFIGQKPFCGYEKGDCDCVFGWRGGNCEEHAKRWLDNEVDENEWKRDLKHD